MIVCDGFTGNVALKISEGLVEMVEALLSEELSSTFAMRVGSLLTRRALRHFRRRVDYSEYGGAPLLGVAGVTIVGHGRSSAKAVRNAVAMAYRFAAERFIERVEREIAAARGIPPVIAFIFPGQGSQKVGMGKALADAFPICRETFAEADAALGEPLSRICFEGPEDQLTLTENTQPAILAVSIAACRLLASRGLDAGVRRRPQPRRVLGERRRRHLRVRRRAADRAAPRPVHAGGGAGRRRARWRRFSVSTPRQVAQACAEAAEGEVVSPANLNGAGQVVIAGRARRRRRAPASARRRSAPGASFRSR